MQGCRSFYIPAFLLVRSTFSGCSMHKHDHLRRKAIELRQRHALSLDEIVERLQLPKTTIYYWIKDIPLQRSTRPNVIRASEVNQEKARLLREAAYQQGIEEAETLFQYPTFRDFVVLYLAEGFRKTRHRVEIANSNPKIIAVAHYWMSQLSLKPIHYSLQIHIDNDEGEVKSFWADFLHVDPDQIKVIRKSNSGEMSGRVWRSVHGVLSCLVHDTYFRARLQAWMDIIQEQW